MLEGGMKMDLKMIFFCDGAVRTAGFLHYMRVKEGNSGLRYKDVRMINASSVVKSG